MDNGGSYALSELVTSSIFTVNATVPRCENLNSLPLLSKESSRVYSIHISSVFTLYNESQNLCRHFFPLTFFPSLFPRHFLAVTFSASLFGVTFSASLFRRHYFGFTSSPVEGKYLSPLPLAYNFLLFYNSNHHHQALPSRCTSSH